MSIDMIDMVVRQGCTVRGSHIHQSAEAVMNELVTLSEAPGSGVLDSAVDVDAAQGQVWIEVTVPGDDEGAAINHAPSDRRGP